MNESLNVIINMMNRYAQAVFSSSIYYFAIISFTIAIALLIRLVYVSIGNVKLKNSYLYYGTVKHTRLKGGAIHHFQYPICFSFLDIDELNLLGWAYWPVFKLNSPWFTFSSLENKHHLIQLPSDNQVFDLPSRVRTFVAEQTKNKRIVQSISLLTHLTYFGYCFNPISLYYINYDDVSKIKKDTDSTFQESIIAEVSNTPWIEQHSYMLDENVGNCDVKRDKSDNKNSTFEATWLKLFHVSPFMEMDYKYNFQFSRPEQVIWVRSKLIKLATKEIWFTANFEMDRIAFTPVNILYILLFYPLHTRIIQILIHWEAVRLALKGVPTFSHPNNVDINFGFGVTDKHLIAIFLQVSQYFENVTSFLFMKTSKKRA